MMETIKNNSNFKKEINLFKKTIKEIENPERRNQAQLLLDNLIREVSIIDATHHITAGPNLDPKKIRENVYNLANLRSQLQKLVKDSK